MPWTKKQNRLFRAAEHDPAFAKKVGIKQSDAKRMAHEGVKMAKGGTFLKQGVGNRDTKHGLLDLPVTIGKAPKKPRMRFADGGSVMDKVDSMQTDAKKVSKEAPKETPKDEVKRPTYAGAVRDRVVTALGGKQAYKAGGMVRCRDGCAVRGRTKGRMV